MDRIGKLYHLNNERCASTGECHQQTQQVEKQLEHIKQQKEAELARPKLNEKARKVLESLDRHWEGLTRFVDNADIPMDNNAAERSLRNPIVGRKNYYGSGSHWSGELAASLFSILMTLNRWQISLHKWLNEYLQACAENGRKPPKALSDWLPWEMSKERLAALTNPQ